MTLLMSRIFYICLQSNFYLTLFLHHLNLISGLKFGTYYPVKYHIYVPNKNDKFQTICPRYPLKASATRCWALAPIFPILCDTNVMTMLSRRKRQLTSCLTLYIHCYLDSFFFLTCPQFGPSNSNDCLNSQTAPKSCKYWVLYSK